MQNVLYFYPIITQAGGKFRTGASPLAKIDT